MIEYIGKCLLIDKELLVIGDLHLGYVESLHRSGIYVPADLYSVIKDDLENILERVGSVKTVVVLGDIKHAMGAILGQERRELTKLFELLSGYAQELVFVKGNHDVMLEPLLRGTNVKLVNFYRYNQYIFVHGDRDFDDMREKDVKIWVMGHLHPAVTLREGAKAETYKCFLVGTFKRRQVIVVPSFFPFSEGSDPRSAARLPWDLPFGAFTVKVVGDNLKVLDFGLLRTIAD